MSLRLIVVIIILSAGMVGGALVFGERVPSPPKVTAMPGNFEGLMNKPAPNFSLPDQSGKLFQLSDYRGKKVVLFFNEGIMCYPACWDQMAELGKDAGLNSAGIISASIVTDQRSAWDSAMKKMPDLTKGKILYDSDKNVSTMYGVLSLPSSMHKGGMPGHTYIIVDGNGVVRYTNDDPAMGIHNREMTAELMKI